MLSKKQDAKVNQLMENGWYEYDLTRLKAVMVKQENGMILFCWVNRSGTVKKGK